jgi:hypothetical protein
MFMDIFNSIQLFSIDWTFAHLLEQVLMTLQTFLDVKVKFLSRMVDDKKNEIFYFQR